MNRYLCGLAVLGVTAAPDGASGYHPCPPPPCGVVYGPPVVLVPAYPGVYPPARVMTAAPGASAPVSPKPARPAAPPTIELARPMPAPGSDAEPAAAVPPPPAAEVRPAAATAPAAPPRLFPEPPTAKPTATSDTLPPLDVPLAPASPPARPPAASPLDPKKPDELPPLVLPPDGPGGPSGVVPPGGGVRARSSPVGTGPDVQVYTAAGDPPAGPTRPVGFFNHTGSAVELVIEGKRVTLPRKSVITAQVKPTFKWAHGGGEATTATVPADAAGLDVVFRE